MPGSGRCTPRRVGTTHTWRCTIIEKFAGCMDGSKDAEWPRENFLLDGLLRIESKFLPELRKWVAAQQRLEEVEEEDDDEEEEDDDQVMADEDA